VPGNTEHEVLGEFPQWFSSAG